MNTYSLEYIVLILLERKRFASTRATPTRGARGDKATRPANPRSAAANIGAESLTADNESRDKPHGERT